MQKEEARSQEQEAGARDSSLVSSRILASDNRQWALLTSVFCLLPPVALSGYHQQTFRAVMVTAGTGSRWPTSQAARAPARAARRRSRTPSRGSGRAISSGRTPISRRSRRTRNWRKLDPDLQAALLENPPARPFSCTLVFCAVRRARLRRGPGAREGQSASTSKPARATGCAIARDSRPTRCRRSGTCGSWSGASTPARCSSTTGRCPFARELWLPLLWYLLPR